MNLVDYKQMFQTLGSRDDVDGSGIGLSTVKKVVEARGGKVAIESAVGRGAKNLDLAHKFIDFLASAKFQEDMPLQMFVFPVNPQAALPDAFIKYAQIPAKPARMPAAEIAKNRDAWIQSWTEAVTH